MTSPSHKASTGWLMVAIAAIAQNCAIGLNFASYGTLISVMETRFETSRALVAAGPGAMVLMLSLCSPLVGGLLQKTSTKWVMISGALLSSAGYLILPLINNIYGLLLIYGLMIGVGSCLLGIVPASTLVSRWFVQDRGKALGIINMPIMLLLVPPIISYFVPTIGLNGIFMALAATFGGVALLLLRVIDKPEDVGLRARGEGEAASPAHAQNLPAALSKGDLLKAPRFWLLSLGIGLLTSGGTMIVVHFVPFGAGRGLTLGEAALLISAFGGAGTVGALFFGWMIDKIGAMKTLIANATLQAILWCGLFLPLGFSGLLPLAATFGMCAGGIIATHSSALNELFGRESFSQAMGLSYLLKLPFIVFAAPLAGWLFDLTQGYSLAFTIHIAAFVLSALLFMQLARLASRHALASREALTVN